MWSALDKTGKSGSDGRTALRRRWCWRAATGQSGEPGILGSGTHKARWKNWMVLVAWMLRKAPCCDMWKSERRGTLGELTRADGTTKLDFRKKEKNATRNKARMAAWSGWVASNRETIRESRMGVIASLRAGAAPKNRLQPRKANWKEYKFSHPGGKPNKRW